MNTKLKNALFIAVTTLFLCSCSGKSSSSELKVKIKLGTLLANTFNKETIDSQIRRDSYSIIGNGLYIQTTNVYSSNVYKNIKDSEVLADPLDFNTRYGGGIVSYSFDKHVIKFWDNYLFIEGDKPYKGVFYQAESSIQLSESNLIETFLSLHVDEGELKNNQNLSQNSDELRSELNTLKFHRYSGNKTYANTNFEISLNGIDSCLKVYDEKVFQVFQNPDYFELEEGFSFSFLSK